LFSSNDIESFANKIQKNADVSKVINDISLDNPSNIINNFPLGNGMTIAQLQKLEQLSNTLNSSNIDDPNKIIDQLFDIINLVDPSLLDINLNIKYTKEVLLQM